jgi:uncharacterized radical SAM superfamily Fe-S cluster-containing enzyme
MATADPKVLRKTRGTCPVCVEMVPAQVIAQDGQVFVEKDCPDHGKSLGLLSGSPEYFSELLDFYHDVVDESYPQRDYILRLTGRCNLACPICLASSDEFEEQDLPVEAIRKLVKGRKRIKLDLMGAEPTLREDLESLVKEIRAAGHINALHTNGIRLAEPGYLEGLVRAGLDEVHLQCDGFNEDVDTIIRGKPMGQVRKEALAELERLNVATDLVVTVLKGLNEPEMPRVLDYAAKHPFVKEVFFLGCRRLGRATEEFEEQVLAPDELIDPLAEQTEGKIKREDIRIFQKLYFSLLSIFRVRKCFYIHHYLLLRDKGSYRPVSEYLDLKYLDPKLEDFRKRAKKSKRLATYRLFWHVGVAILRKGGFRLLWDGIVLNMMLKFGFNLGQIRRNSILLGFITACDPWIFDEQVSANCGKGELSTDEGLHDSGALANVTRERSHRDKQS